MSPSEPKCRLLSSPRQGVVIACLFVAAMALVIASGCTSLAPYNWDQETKEPAKPVAKAEKSPFVEEAPPLAKPVDSLLSPSVGPHRDPLPPPPPSPPVQPAGVSAGEPDWHSDLTLEQVLEYTTRHHPLLRMRKFEIEAAKGRLITAGLLPNPEFVMQTDTEMEKSEPTVMMTRLMFTIPIGPKLFVAKQSARADICKTQWNLSNETQQVLIAAATAALDLQYIQELARLQGHLAELAAQQAEIQAESFQLGGVTYANRMTTALDATSAELTALNLKTQLEVARVGLSRAMGLTTPVQPKMQGMMPVAPVGVLPLEKLVEEARRVRPDLAAARASLQKSQEDVRVNRWKAVPDLTIGPRVVDLMSSRPGDSVGFRMQTEVPVFDRNQGGIAESKAIVGVQAALLDNVQIQSLSDVASTYVELLALQTQLQYYDQNVAPMINKTEGQIVEMFRDRAVPAYQVAQMLQQFSGVRLKQIELRYRYNQRRMQLEILLGRSLAAETIDQIGLIPSVPPSDVPDLPAMPTMQETAPSADLLPGDFPANGSLREGALPGDLLPEDIVPVDPLPLDAMPLDAQPEEESPLPEDSLLEDPLSRAQPLPRTMAPPRAAAHGDAAPGVAVAEDVPANGVIQASATDEYARPSPAGNR